MARITQVLKIDIHDGNYCNPFGLEWLDQDAGMNTWVFENRQDVSANTSTIGPYQNIPLDLESSDGFDRILGKEMRRRYALSVTGIKITDKMEGFLSLKHAQMVWHVEKDTHKRTRVKVVDGSFRAYKTSDTFANVELTVEFGTEYSQLG